MIRKILAMALLAASLGGCSYSYDLIVAVQSGHITIGVDPASSQRPSCLRKIYVYAEDERAVTWRESVSYDDDCANKFPLTYGQGLGGKHQGDRGEVTAKALRRETIYEVKTTTGATGYGYGRFIIHEDGMVQNLPAKLFSSDAGN
ncbi:hypothetical protein WSK_2920 [Novosphingobium sp. Rr 2-17]|uniref:hypothetical protein n=1 Tax=Novosphingobium sp. Rr 2-17 TaxID=555793 RepID=UPI000269A204|nr:hypothetical protein [Novosphingobium sp. Rr 2-17]EIZ78476.1 hypothetical protein WSK_2920 [Novosphingobium sp. Rr 2-17]